MRVRRYGMTSPDACLSALTRADRQARGDDVPEVPGLRSRGPVVEALAGLLAQLTGGDLVDEQLRWGEPRAERGRQVSRDVQADVEPDEIAQPQRAHRVAIAQLHRLVD